MNKNIELLYQLSVSEYRYIVGLMSGTSLDGLDIAYCKISGNGSTTKVELLSFETISYPHDVKEKIRKIFAQSLIDLPYLAMLNEWIGDLHGEMINSFLIKNNVEKSKVDLIASHGQTVMHAPKHQHGLSAFPNATLQIGDGDHISVKTGVITISDFRQKHLAAGGEGAPLAVYGDYLLFSDYTEDRIMLNIGGIANFTYLPAGKNADEILVTDTGPGNTLMDACMVRYFDRSFDTNAEIARNGQVNNYLLEVLKSHIFFQMPFPKSTGPELFNTDYIDWAIAKSSLEHISPEDVLATLNKLSAETIAAAIRSVTGSRAVAVYISGGGAYNPLLVDTLKSLLHYCNFYNSDVLGLPVDAKEAVLFAILANETIAGNPNSVSSRQNIPAITMGKISLPS